MKPGYIVVAETDADGRLTGIAEEAQVGKKEGIYPSYTTFGTWDAYEETLAAQEKEEAKWEEYDDCSDICEQIAANGAFKRAGDRSPYAL